MHFTYPWSRMRSHQQIFSLALVILLLLVDPLVPGSPAQQKQDSTAQTVDWKSLTREIEAVLREDSEFKLCYPERRWVVVVQSVDVTGDGVPEALVQFCHMGAYTSDVVLMRFEQGKPVLAKFRRKNGKIVPTNFLQGASARNGENTMLLREKHAVYAIQWHTDDSGRLEKCTVEAYSWAAKSGTFDASGTLSKEIAKNDCRRLQEGLEREIAPSPKQQPR